MALPSPFPWVAVAVSSGTMAVAVATGTMAVATENVKVNSFPSAARSHGE